MRSSNAALGLLATVGLLLQSTPLHAQELPVTLELRPHCIAAGEGATFQRATKEQCLTFETKDPLTRQTPLLRAGETLQLDVTITDPQTVPLSRFSVWLAYDPTILEVLSVETNPAFGIPTPGTPSFSGDGYVKIEASADPSVIDGFLVLARMRMQVRAATVPSTVITFFDPSGTLQSRTAVISGEGQNARNLIAGPMGSLLVRLEQQAPASSAASSAPIASEAASSEASAALTSSSSLAPMSGASSGGMSSTGPIGVSGLFSEYQVQVIGIGTEDTTAPTAPAYVAWKPLTSSEVAGYNIYYGTRGDGDDAGVYLHRHSVDAKSTSLTIRGLPTGTTYYVAIRAFNRANEESRFSQEMAITVGKKKSASHILGSIIDPGPQGEPPETGGEISGETGQTTVLLLLLFVSAVIGTLLAFRRQLIAATVRAA